MWCLCWNWYYWYLYYIYHISCAPPPDTSPTTTVDWSPPTILGHHQHNNNDVDFNATITPIKFDFFHDYSPNADRKALQELSILCLWLFLSVLYVYFSFLLFYSVLFSINLYFCFVSAYVRLFTKKKRDHPSTSN